MNYSIIKELGQGGMATVYLAEDKKFQTQVALKVLNKDLAHNENIRKRFLAEARNMYKMSHPNIIKVTDLIDEGDTVAFVMEHIDGETLKEYLERKGKLTDDEIRNIFSQMLEAVGYVHKKGLIHRDIKPSNFMIDKEGTVKLLDFGIAKNTDSSSAEYTQTGTGMQMGTPMYMSPEQVKNTKEVTFQSDIFSLGVVLWQMVMGKKPYNGDTLSAFEIQLKIFQEPLSKTKTQWDNIIQKATDKLEKNRFEDCLLFKNALEQLKSIADDKTVLFSEKEKKKINTIKTVSNKKMRSDDETVLEKGILPKTTTDSFGMEFILVEAGTFMMGANSKDMDAADDEKPAHLVTLTESYYIGKFPVTQSQWKKIMGNNPSNFEDCPNCPVDSVSWDDCQKFIKKLNAKTGKIYRLPTEAEWEFAARGANKSKGFIFSGSNKLEDVAWYGENSEVIVKVEKKALWGLINTMEDLETMLTHDVGKKRPNELGIYDMSGNVWEWCMDFYDDYDGQAETNPTGPIIGKYRILRGGSWYDDKESCRLSRRDGNDPDCIDYGHGLRLIYESR